jgi:hypothetical protein
MTSLMACVIFFLLPYLVSSVWSLEVRKSSKCERITIPMCQDMPYNLTRMPNLMGHKDQSEAAIQVHEFIPLVEIRCSKKFKIFSLFIICSDVYRTDRYTHTIVSVNLRRSQI